MNTFLNEGIIPQNFNWRAGIGKDINQSLPHHFNIPTNQTFVDDGIFLVKANEPIKYPGTRVDLTEQLIPEINTQVNDTLERYFNRELDTRLMMEIKDAVKRVCNGIKSRYNGYFTEGFYNAFYYECKMNYENEFINLKEGITPFTEFVSINGKIYMNPITLYGFFQM